MQQTAVHYNLREADVASINKMIVQSLALANSHGGSFTMNGGAFTLDKVEIRYNGKNRLTVNEITEPKRPIHFILRPSTAPHAECVFDALIGEDGVSLLCLKRSGLSAEGGWESVIEREFKKFLTTPRGMHI